MDLLVPPNRKSTEEAKEALTFNLCQSVECSEVHVISVSFARNSHELTSLHV